MIWNNGERQHWAQCSALQNVLQWLKPRKIYFLFIFFFILSSDETARTPPAGSNLPAGRTTSLLTSVPRQEGTTELQQAKEQGLSGRRTGREARKKMLWQQQKLFFSSLPQIIGIMDLIISGVSSFATTAHRAMDPGKTP